MGTWGHPVNKRQSQGNTGHFWCNGSPALQVDSLICCLNQNRISIPSLSLSLFSFSPPLLLLLLPLLFLLLFLYSGFLWWRLMWRVEFFRERGKVCFLSVHIYLKGMRCRNSGAISLVLLFWAASVLSFSMNQHFSQLPVRWSDVYTWSHSEE